MDSDVLNLNQTTKKITGNVKRRGADLNTFLRFDGYNSDITEAYYWNIHFPYYVGKGYVPLKLEDYHYFSENSQFGSQMRQIKGGSIRAFQENLQQLIQLVKVHIIPLLKEVKQAEFYKTWFDDITKNDELIQKELKKSSPNQENLKKWRAARNEAINHIKDQWVNNVDGGRIWQMNRSATEQGLDFALLPQLFFGVSLDNPLYYLHRQGPTLKEQLDGDIYNIDISTLAKESVARFLYKFHAWLPTAIKETEVTYRLKINSLKQFYTQIQMYINFMKPLLIEITRKSEGFQKGKKLGGVEEASLYRNFELENAEIVNLFDYSYSFIKVLGIKGFGIRGNKYGIQDLEISKYGFFVPEKEIQHGEFKEKPGYILYQEKDTDLYAFLPCSKGPKDMNIAEYSSLIDAWNKNKKFIHKDEMKQWLCMEFNFIQKRRSEIMQTEQGAQQVPYMRNQVDYLGYAWNLFEIATYRDELKLDNLKLLEAFIEDIRAIKEDLLYYVNDLEGVDKLIKPSSDSKNSSSSSNKEKEDSFDLILAPFKGLGDLFSPLVPRFEFNEFNKKKESNSKNSARDDDLLVARLSIVEDTWKCYNIFKKSRRFVSF